MFVEKKKIKVALLAFVAPDGTVLLNRRAGATTEMWEIIGGGIENGETALTAIKREILEEVHYSLDDEKDKLTFVENFNYETEIVDADVTVFKAVYPGVEKFADSDETFVADLKLFTVADALQLPLLPMTRIILEENLLSRVEP